MQLGCPMLAYQHSTLFFIFTDTITNYEIYLFIFHSCCYIDCDTILTLSNLCGYRVNQFVGSICCTYWCCRAQDMLTTTNSHSNNISHSSSNDISFISQTNKQTIHLIELHEAFQSTPSLPPNSLHATINLKINCSSSCSKRIPPSILRV